MTPIEKMAIALSRADPDERGLPDGVDMATFYRGLARAALEALMEPSEAMLEAGSRECDRADVEPTIGRRKLPRNVLRAMIQAALNEEGK